MIKISSVVYDILTSSEIAFEAMKEGFLNLSSFAEYIHLEVEKKTHKEVKKATIVVALVRIAQNLPETSSLRPNFFLDTLSIKSPLVDITYEKSIKNLEKARSLVAELSQSQPQFLTITQGTDEITIIASQENLAQILAIFKVKPKSIFRDLVGITVSFSEKYLNQPNIIYSILSMLAMKRINILEVVSTFTELTVLINKNQLEGAVHSLQGFFLDK